MRSIFVRFLLGAFLACGFTAEVRAQPKKTATVSLGNLNQIYAGSPRAASATTNAPGTSSFKFTYNGSSVAPTAAGSYPVVCTLVNSKYQGRATGTLIVAKAKTTTVLALSPNTAKVGQTITLAAVVKPTLNAVAPAGAVTFKDGDKTIKTVNLADLSGTAMTKVNLLLTAGSHAFTAVYSGNANFAASASPVTKR